MRYFQVFLALSGAVALGSCGQTPSPASTPQTYVLVHGALLGEYSWKRVERRLVADGNTVVTLDLPGHGADQTPIDQITLKSYTDAVVNAIGDRTGVILVGHSLGGVVVSQVAEAVPNKISKLVYLSALIPKDGETANELIMMDQNSLFGNYVTQTSNALVFSPAGVQPVFCNDCTPADVALIKSNLRPEPLAPLTTPVNLTAANYGSVPKYDILTSMDHAISYQFQQTLKARLNFVNTFVIDSSHVSFFSKPEVLTQILEGL